MKFKLANCFLSLITIVIVFAHVINTQLLSAQNQSPFVNDYISDVRAENSGLYAIWYGSQMNLLNLPGIVGGQVVVDWKDVEKSKGVYDFTAITTKINQLKSLGKVATVQINGSKKPDYLFNEVPWVAEKLHHSIKDDKGSLMFWHPNHLNAYKKLIEAYGKYIETRKNDFLGVRLNFNPLGTEITFVRAPYRDADAWIYPSGVEKGVDWTNSVAREYEIAVTNEFIEHLAPHIKLFLRATTDFDLNPSLLNSVKNGEMSVFMTSAESEARLGSHESELNIFYDYCRPGNTTGYAESFASAWGHHGGTTEHRAETPPEWFRWRILFDLHLGISHIAIYASDLNVALNGTYKFDGVVVHDDKREGTSYKNEFLNAMEFGWKYAGYHSAPTQSPGAWVAFRENYVARNLFNNNNHFTVAQRTLKVFTGDYDFLMKRKADQTVPVEFIGDRKSGYGSWARKIPSGKSMELIPDTDFLASLEAATVNITWYDSIAGVGDGQLEIIAGNSSFTINPTGTNKWITSSFYVSDVSFNSIKIYAKNSDFILHMVELTRDLSNSSENNDKLELVPTIYSTYNNVIVEDIPIKSSVQIFNIEGKTVYNNPEITENRLEICLDESSIYLIKVNNSTFKHFHRKK